ncbi:RWD domain-containing protein 2B [Amia ocellicauda]|uniref:RWD domain-containing protein 2B n=1 Tax=Amia ocellicauda TaxID=2972642 RepID=UPI0034642752|nr:RWD2B protein [Amia calva]
MAGAEEAATQLSEIELLLSMFPSQEEFVIDDQLAVAELRDYAEGRTATLPTSRARITVRQKLDTASGNVVVFSVSCIYVINYPTVLPEITVRSSELNRSQQTHLHTDLNAYLKENCCGELCVLAAIEWVKDNAHMYLNKGLLPDLVQAKKQDPSGQGAMFTRLWIYSHHIYNKQKRKNILDWSKELGLTGFSMPGKPGIVCAEGPQIACEEFWARLRRLTWQRILIRHREDIPLDSDGIGTDSLQRFTGFEEAIFDTRGNRGNHMDLGQLYHFLNEKGCGDVFQLYFGIEGR